MNDTLNAVETMENLEKSLDTSEASTEPKKNIYDITGNDDLLESIPTLNFVELNNLKKDLKTQIENLEGAMNLINSIDNMGNVDDTNKKIMAENILNDNEYKEDSEAFKAAYPTNKQKLDAIMTAIEEKAKEYDVIEKTTQFFTEQMIESINKKIDRINTLTDPSLNNKMVLKVLNRNLEAFKTRHLLDYIAGRASKEYIVNKLRKELRNNQKTCVKISKGEFGSILSLSHVAAFEQYVLELFDNDEFATNLFMYHLARTIRSEFETGNYIFVKLLVLNVIDIQANIYDLDGGKEKFDDQLRNLYKFYR